MEFAIYLYYLSENHNNLMEQQRSKLNPQQIDSLSSDTIPSFLLKTFDILQNQKYSDIICWTRNGEGFIVKNVKDFSENVLPIYFRHSNYTSFVRQLNMYDFHKTRQQNHENAFKNLMFKRGYRHLLKDIQRKDYKKNKDSNKETTANQKTTLDKPIKQDKIDNLTNDINKQNIKKINQITSLLEKKALSLVEIRKLPSNQVEMLKLLDTLFDAKKLHKELANRMRLIGNYFSEAPAQQQNKDFNLKIESSCEKIEDKADCPTTQIKTTIFELPKEQRPITTNCTLFSSFNQI